ncbi:MAG TPA: TolC family protein [Desulfobulbus sp.]|nr:TolC family protein [Desulfobulbus sp.]
MIDTTHRHKPGLSARHSSRIPLLLFLLFFVLPQPVHAAPEGDTLPEQWTVKEAVNFALASNPDARIALHRISAAQASINQAQAAFFPKLGVNVEYGQTNNPMYSFGNILNQGSFTNTIDFNHPGTTDNLRLAARLKYRLYNGGRDQAGVRSATAQQQAEEWQRTAILSRLSFEVVRSFYTIIQAGEIVAARKSAITAIETSLAVARARYEAGDLLKASLLDIEVQQSVAHEQLIQARHGLNLAKRAFLNLLGLKQKEVHLDLAQHFPQNIPTNPNSDQRPEIRSLNARILMAREQLEKAMGGYYPTADLFGSYQVDQGFVYEENSGNSWMAGVRLNYTLYDGKNTSAAVARAKADLIQTQEMKRKSVLDIGLEIEKAELALQQAEERLQVTKKMVELAEESARLSRERFREGVILSSTLLDAENRLTDARVHASLAKAARAIAIADLRRATGLPQFNEVLYSQKQTEEPTLPQQK